MIRIFELENLNAIQTAGRPCKTQTSSRVSFALFSGVLPLQHDLCVYSSDDDGNRDASSPYGPVR